jgi:hypothetical protein
MMLRREFTSLDSDGSTTSLVFVAAAALFCSIGFAILGVCSWIALFRELLS